MRRTAGSRRSPCWIPRSRRRMRKRPCQAVLPLPGGRADCGMRSATDERRMHAACSRLAQQQDAPSGWRPRDAHSRIEVRAVRISSAHPVIQSRGDLLTPPTRVAHFSGHAQGSSSCRPVRDPAQWLPGVIPQAPAGTANSSRWTEAKDRGSEPPTYTVPGRLCRCPVGRELDTEGERGGRGTAEK